MECCLYRSARQSDMQMLRSELGQGTRNRLSRLLEFSCTRQEWILLGFEAGVLSGALALAAPSEFNVPLEIIWLHGGLDGKTGSLGLFKLAIELAKTLGARELYCTVSEDSADSSVILDARFRRSRKVVRFESTGLVDLSVRGYRSAEVSDFKRSEIIALIEKTSESCSDSLVEEYRRRLGAIADAEMTLEMMESTKYEPRWWRVAIGPEGNNLGIIFPVVAFGELTVGFIGVIPEYRGRSIASFLLSEAWSIVKLQGYLTLCAEVDAQSVSMQRALAKSQFSRRSTMQEWRLEL